MTLRDVAVMLHAGIERDRGQWRHTATITAAAHAIMNEKPKTPEELMPWAFGADEEDEEDRIERLMNVL